MRVLILGGTAEARALATQLHVRPDITVTSSLAGRVSNPALPVGDVRVGGFGGADGLADYLRLASVDVLLDATHPFAATISAHAAQAAAVTGVPLLALRRPGWQETPGDQWLRVPDTATAAAVVAALPGSGCIFVTTGRRDLGAFAADGTHAYLVRTVDPPEVPLPPRVTVLLDRGPYTVSGETRLLTEHRVSALVTKDSGGELTSAKLVAARERRIPVVMVDRPAVPAGVRSVATVGEVMAWLGSAAG